MAPLVGAAWIIRQLSSSWKLKTVLGYKGMTTTEEEEKDGSRHSVSRCCLGLPVNSPHNPY